MVTGVQLLDSNYMNKVKPEIIKTWVSKGIIIQQGGQYYTTEKTTAGYFPESCFAKPQAPVPTSMEAKSGTGFIAGAPPEAKNIKGVATVTHVGDSFEVRPANADRVIFDGAVDGEHERTATNVTTSTTSQTTIDLSKYGQTLVQQLQQVGLVSTANSDYTACVVADGKSKDIAKILAQLDSMPNKMDEVQLQGDASVKQYISEQLQGEGIVDKDGNIIDKAKFGQLFDLQNGTMTIGDQIVDFRREKDGTQNVNFTETTTTVIGSKFKELDPAIIARMKAQSPDHWEVGMQELEKHGQISIVDGRYFTSNPDYQKKGPADNSGENLKPEELITVQADGKVVANKANQKDRLTYLQDRGVEMYDTNPANAQDTLLHTKYYESYQALNTGLREIDSAKDVNSVKQKDWNNDPKYRRKGMLARQYYAQSRKLNVTSEEVQAKAAELGKLSPKELIAEYTKEFGQLPTDMSKLPQAVQDKLNKSGLEELSDAELKLLNLTPEQKNNLAKAKAATVYEYASPEELRQFEDRVNTRYQTLVNGDLNYAIDRYKTFFGDVNDDIDTLSEQQYRELAETMVYNEGLSDAQIKHMASTQFHNRFNTEMNTVYNEYQEKIAEATAKGDNKKVEKLQAKLNEKLGEIRERQVRTENEDRGDYAAMVARGQLNSEIAEATFNSKKGKITYEGILKDCPEAKAFIEANKDRFYINGQFDAGKWQDFWLQKSSSKEDNNIANDNVRIQDYFMSLGEANRLLRGNPKGTDDERYIGLKALFPNIKDESTLINIARKMAGTAGMSTEANNTAGIRAAYVVTETVRGGAEALAADVLGRFALSKIKVPYFDKAIGFVTGTLTGTVTGTATGTVNFSRSGVIQDLDRFVSNTYDNGVLIDQQITEVTEEHPWHCEGSEAYSQDFSKDYKQDYKQGYSQDVSGTTSLAFKVDPISIAVGAGIRGIRALCTMKNYHDHEDGKSRMNQYSRRDFNERPDGVSTTNVGKTEQVPVYRYVASVDRSTPPVDIQNDDYKITYTPKQTDAQGRVYRDFQDKQKVVAKYYNLTGNEPYFNDLYKFVMEQTNGLKGNQYGQSQYVNGTTYHFPQTILADQIEGLQTAINADPNADLASIPKDVRVYIDDNGKGFKNSNNTTQREGEAANGTLTARRRK